jgi:heme exporter protein D
MSFHSVGDFLAMGGHALYVWLAYGAAVLVVVGNVVSVRVSRRRYLREARALERRLSAGGTSVPAADPIHAGRPPSSLD